MSKKTLDVDNMSAEERRKMKALLNEKYNEDGSSKEKVSWMYQKEKIDTEDYLLGKKVTTMEEINLKDDFSGALASGGDITKVDGEIFERRGKMDMEAKMREDPLELIKAKEIDSKRRLVENTAKLKRLQKMVEQQNKSSSSKKHKKKSKKKKSKKSKHSSSSDQSETSDSDDEILNKFMTILKSKQEASSKNGEKASTKENGKQRDTSPHGRHSPSPPYQRKSYQSSSSHNRRRSRSRSPRTRRSRSSSHDRYRHGNIRRSRSKSPMRSKTHQNKYEASNQRRRSPVATTTATSKNKRSTEEMARLREQMMSDAKSRDVERVSRVESYREEKRREELEQARQDRGAGFLKPMVMGHADTATVAENVKRRLHSVQKKPDSSFMRK